MFVPTLPSISLHNSTSFLISFPLFFSSSIYPSSHPSNLNTFSLTLSLPSPLSLSFPPTCFHFFLLLPEHIPLSPYRVSQTMLFSTYCLLRGNVTPLLMLVHLWFTVPPGCPPFPAYTNPHITADTRDLQCFENKQVKDRSQHSI